ncbi:antibiotic biosynthesis monooxygenase [Marinobacter hydrocarbonoclasticus]|uniref:antibiotic biosynthesis monooxygenase family protein n=1 Tax=Marinobacter TaxID=2742 RepID=UPI001A8C8268|nr:antibiotic biosynthesis monooxygenase [Marinobacter nauticus]MBN8240690.1 antibiotic biosynthesis monooxygenase [Marinobacter nauticus]
MHAREWKCRVPKDKSEGFLGYLYATGVKDTCNTDGFLGAQIYRRGVDGLVEFTLTTYWRDLESIKDFAGDDIGIARLYPEDDKYDLEPDLAVQHYEVIEHSFVESMRGADN